MKKKKTDILRGKSDLPILRSLRGDSLSGASEDDWRARFYKLAQAGKKQLDP